MKKENSCSLVHEVGGRKEIDIFVNKEEYVVDGESLSKLFYR